eukprot:CAMPEP_0172860594 /NCGR_PEP_ID=MMETSP1075-20121228/72171_1 /TAXON_ID=2916 /ORGANISM="Ceratium fusus, Strain PA161109" /LENGTH=798 /DNA_ID=CAMNT_0013708639 /DNA_START=43 /DNA_END=2436 /DNA_ORIENTATION=-
MGELYLAILACEWLHESSGNPAASKARAADEISCAVALGSAYLRTAVPSGPVESLRCWQVPNAFSVCTVAVTNGSASLGTVSVPVLRLRQSADQTLDQWLPVAPSPTLEGHSNLPVPARLRLLLHLRLAAKRGREADNPNSEPGVVPASFEQRYRELLAAHAERKPGRQRLQFGVASADLIGDDRNDAKGRSISVEHASSLLNSPKIRSSSSPTPPAHLESSVGSRDSPAAAPPRRHGRLSSCSPRQSSPDTGPPPPPRQNTCRGLRGEVSASDARAGSCRADPIELCMAGIKRSSSELRGGDVAQVCSQLEQLLECCRSFEAQRQRAPPIANERSGSATVENAPQMSDEACMQLAAQKTAMEREKEELHAHWHALSADFEVRRYSSEESAEAHEAAQEELALMESELAQATLELQSMQRDASAHLVARKRLQRELAACAEAFSSEMASQRAPAEHLREERAVLRESAVGLGQELQICVCACDELVSENLQSRSEAASLQADCVRLQHERGLHDKDGSMQEAASLCEDLWTLRHCWEEKGAGLQRLHSSSRFAESGVLEKVAHTHGSPPSPRWSQAVSQNAIVIEGQDGNSDHNVARSCETGNERSELLSLLGKQDKEIRLLHAEAQQLSGDVYAPGPELPDQVDSAVASAFRSLGLGVAPPLVRLAGPPSVAAYLFDTVECEAQVMHANSGGDITVRFRVVDQQPPEATPEWPAPALLCQTALDGTCTLSGHTQSSTAREGGGNNGSTWLTAAQLAEVAGWQPKGMQCQQQCAEEDVYPRRLCFSPLSVVTSADDST